MKILETVENTEDISLSHGRKKEGTVTAILGDAGARIFARFDLPAFKRRQTYIGVENRRLKEILR